MNTQAAETVLLDENALTQIRALSREGEEDFLNSMVDMFLERAPTLLNDIKTALHEHDAAKCSRSSHALKGSCGNLGARKMAALCDQLEHFGYDNNLGTAGPLLSELESTFVETKRALMIWRV